MALQSRPASPPDPAQRGQLRAFYSEDRGAPSTPLRAQVGTLMLKHLRNLSDREAVHLVLENIYAQRFCGLSPA